MKCQFPDCSCAVILGVKPAVCPRGGLPESLYCINCDEDKITIRTKERSLSNSIRPEVAAFALAMEAKLYKNDNKTSWRSQPIEALFKLLLLEVEEFRVADEFFPVADARKELVDIANFAMMLHDRLGMIDQDKTRYEQK